MKRFLKTAAWYQLVLNLFYTSVSLKYTIEIIIKQIFEHHENKTTFAKSEMNKLLALCTKNIHFSFNNEIYIQTDRVAMYLPWRL